MSLETLAYNVETWAIAAVQQGSSLTLQMLHVDDSAMAAQERLIFHAQALEKQLPGPQCNEVNLVIELRSTDRNAQDVDQIYSQVEAAMQLPGAIVIADSLFSVLVFYPERMTSQTDRTQNSRVRMRTYPFDVVPLN